jgi:hypothetical protein
MVGASVPVEVRQEEIKVQVVSLQGDGITVDSQLVLCHVDNARSESLTGVSIETSRRRSYTYHFDL